LTKRNRKVVVEDRWEKKKQKGRIVDDKFQHETLPPIQAKTEAQKEFFKLMVNNTVVAAIGPAGTGKTYTSVGTAADKLKRGEIDKICISRSYQMMGNSAGLLPGDIAMKLSPLLMPMLDVLAERLGKNCLETHLANNNIEIVPLETLRGRSFTNAILFIDECQNTTVKEMHSIITRIGDNCQLILLGDDRQKDIKGLSGLEWYCDMVDKYEPEGADYVEFSIEDCVRSDICSQFLRIIDAEASQ